MKMTDVGALFTAQNMVKKNVQLMNKEIYFWTFLTFDIKIKKLQTDISTEIRIFIYYG